MMNNMFKKIVLLILIILFDIFLASSLSPFDSMWDPKALLITKLIFNPIFLSIYLMFAVMVWCSIAYITALLIKGDKHISYVYSNIVFPFRRKNGNK